MNAIVSFRKCTLTDDQLIRKIDELTDKMYQTGEMPPRHIPARPDDDYDLLIGELLLRFRPAGHTMSDLVDKAYGTVTP